MLGHLGRVGMDVSSGAVSLEITALLELSAIEKANSLSA
jgi:hypothetical protein